MNDSYDPTQNLTKEQLRAIALAFEQAGEDIPGLVLLHKQERKASMGKGIYQNGSALQISGSTPSYEGSILCYPSYEGCCAVVVCDAQYMRGRWVFYMFGFDYVEP